MTQFRSIHLYYGCLRPTSPSNPQARAPSPGYTETKSAVPRKRIGENSKTRESYKHIPPRIVTQGSLQVTLQGHMSATGARKTLDTHATQNGTR